MKGRDEIRAAIIYFLNHPCDRDPVWGDHSRRQSPSQGVFMRKTPINVFINIRISPHKSEKSRYFHRSGNEKTYSRSPISRRISCCKKKVMRRGTTAPPPALRRAARNGAARSTTGYRCFAAPWSICRKASPFLIRLP